MEIVRVNLQIAVTLLSRYVRRLAAFEEILDERANMPIGIKRHLFLRLYMEDRWPRRLGNAYSQASADVPSKILFLEMDNRNIKMATKHDFVYNFAIRYLGWCSGLFGNVRQNCPAVFVHLLAILHLSRRLCTD